MVDAAVERVYYTLSVQDAKTCPGLIAPAKVENFTEYWLIEIYHFIPFQMA